jgi:YbbR domain-containing protein
MLNRLRVFIRTIPTLLLAFAMAIAIWVIAVTANDPIEVMDYPSAVPVEVVGLDPHLLITNNIPESVTLKISAPHSVWTDLQSRTQPIHAVVDLSGLAVGAHTVPIQIQVAVKPVRVFPFSPSQVEVNLEELVTRDFPIQVNTSGTPAVGFKVQAPVLNPSTVTVSGPKSIMSTIQKVQVNLSIQGVRENISTTLNLSALDANNHTVTGVDFSPGQMQVNAEVVPLNGYRNVAVKVVWSGNPAIGYQLTSITTNPPAVTVFSQDAQLVENLPGYIETVPLDLNNVKDSFSTLLNLNIPLGITVLDQSSVEVSVGVQPLVGNLTLNNIPVSFTGLAAGLSATVSPNNVTIILSGPLAVLNTVTVQDVQVVVDLTGVTVGSYQKTPQVVIANTNLSLVSIVPESLGIEVSVPVNPTP